MGPQIKLPVAGESLAAPKSATKGFRSDAEADSQAKAGGFSEMLFRAATARPPSPKPDERAFLPIWQEAEAPMTALDRPSGGRDAEAAAQEAGIAAAGLFPASLQGWSPTSPNPSASEFGSWLVGRTWNVLTEREGPPTDIVARAHGDPPGLAASSAPREESAPEAEEALAVPGPAASMLVTSRPESVLQPTGRGRPDEPALSARWRADGDRQAAAQAAGAAIADPPPRTSRRTDAATPLPVLREELRWSPEGRQVSGTQEAAARAPGTPRGAVADAMFGQPTVSAAWAVADGETTGPALGPIESGDSDARDTGMTARNPAPPILTQRQVPSWVSVAHDVGLPAAGQADEAAVRAASTPEARMEGTNVSARGPGAPLTVGEPSEPAASPSVPRQPLQATSSAEATAPIARGQLPTAHTNSGRWSPAVDRRSAPVLIARETYLQPVVPSEPKQAEQGVAANGDVTVPAPLADRFERDESAPTTRIRVPDVLSVRDVGSSLPDVSPVPPVRQIATAISRELSPQESGPQTVPRDGPSLPTTGGRGPTKLLKIALEPAELGIVTVQLRASGSSVNLTMTAERAETSVLLNSDRHTLARILESSGFDVEHVTIQISSPDRVAAGAQLDVAAMNSPPPSMPQTSLGPGAGSDRQHTHREGGRSNFSRKEEQRDEGRDSRRRRGDLYV